MGYALVPLVQVTHPGHGKIIRRLFGFDQSPHTFIILDMGDPNLPESGLCLAYFENDINDIRVIKVADVKDENLAVSSQSTLLNKINGFSFNNGKFNDQIISILKNPKGILPIEPIQPNIFGELVVWLGPGKSGENKFYTEQLGLVKHSKTWTDNFNRADGALNGSTLSGGGTTWVSDSQFTIVSNQLNVSGDVSGSVYKARTSADADTDSIYTQFEFISATGANTYTYLSVGDGTDSNGYKTEQSTFQTELIAINGNTYIASGGSPFSAATWKLTHDGSSVQWWKNGVSNLGPITDTSQSSGAGFRRSAIYIFANAASKSYIVDNFVGGDIYTNITPPVAWLKA